MYQKEIIYMNLFENDIKGGCVGYLKLEKKQESYNVELQVKNVPNAFAGNFPIRLQGENDWTEAAMLAIQGGNGKWMGTMAEPVVRAEVLLADFYRIKGESRLAQRTAAEAAARDIIDNSPPLSREQSSNMQQYDTGAQISAQNQTASSPLTEQPIRLARPNQPAKPSQMRIAETPPLYESKWEQLLAAYEQFHPYGDNRVYIKLEPKDFVILRANYQHLVNNSFLLHGFYNYRYIILGKEKDFYIGVPGVFYEREKMVALMFGFEAFECEGGETEEGKFGYYLRKVEI